MLSRGLLLSALLLLEASAGHVGRRQRGSPLDASQHQEALREKIAVAFSLKSHVAANSPGSAGQQQPVSVQIEDKTVADFKKELSPACEKRFSAMLKGEAPELSTFDAHSGAAAGSKQCGKLEGKLCFTKAAVTEAQDHPDGRRLAQTTEVQGNSCLPQECTDRSDLVALAKFMRGQTAGLMPGTSADVALHVDCSGSGGAVASIDGAGEAAVPAAERAPRSGAREALPWVGTAVAVASALAF